jgi:hypothetical protein
MTEAATTLTRAATRGVGRNQENGLVRNASLAVNGTGGHGNSGDKKHHFTALGFSIAYGVWQSWSLG